MESSINELNNMETEQIWVSLNLGKQRLLVGCIYKPPSTLFDVNHKIIELIKSAKRAIYQRKYIYLVITGDFNYRTIDWCDLDSPYSLEEADNQPNLFIECLDECFLAQFVSEPSFQRVNYESYNILDLVITNDRNKINCIEHSAPLGEANQGSRSSFKVQIRNE